MAERFWNKVERGGPEECHRFTGSLVKGYGSFNVGNRQTELAHRVAWLLEHGEPLPPVLDHTCHNNAPCLGGVTCPHRACCNVFHLEPVTIGENTRRSANTLQGANIRKTHCKHGHPFDEGNTWKEKNGRRHCRECHRISNRASTVRRRAKHR